MRYRLQGSVTIPRKPTTLGGIISWAKGVNRTLAELRDRKIVGSESNRNTNSQPPFFPTLSGDATSGYKLTMKKGWVSSTHWKYGVDSIKTFEVTSIPGDPDPVANALTVSSGTKVYCKLTESVEGEITAAAIESSSSWPESSSAKFTGGDDSTGAAGTRYIRLCEVVTVSSQVKVKVIHTGIIEHSAATLCGNTTTSVSGGEARVMQKWDSATGRWYFRYLKSGEGSLITEDGDYITLSSFISHPWRVTANSSTPASWDVIGDTVYGQGDPIVVANANVVGDVGYVVLKITRDESNREMTAAAVEFAASVTDSDYTYQYRVLAKVDKNGTPKVLQYQFEEIRIFEDMAVVNGEYQLLGLEMSHRNYYDPPA